MRLTWVRTLTLVAGTLVSPLVMAADHTDSPAAGADPTADITDLFTWASADGKTTYFVMDIGKGVAAGTKFSNAVKYVFHTTSMPGYGATGAAVKSLDIICTFDSGTPQKSTCWIGNKDLISGVPTGVGGDGGGTVLTSTSGKVRLFAGMRDDPFFFNVAGFKNVASIVHGVATGATPPTFDADGCPAIGASGPVLASGLASSPDGGPPVDGFATLNTLAIVLAVDTTLVNEGGPVLGVWASTNH